MPPTDVSGQIVAMGGGGFSTEPDNPRLDDFVLSLVSRRPARVCFVPTASADSAVYLANFYRAFAGRAAATDLTLFDAPSLRRRPATTAELAGFVAEQDVLYVGGGSTANLLALWRAHGLDRILRDAWRARRGAVRRQRRNAVLVQRVASPTPSANSTPWTTDLGLIDASACPHYDGEPERRPAYHRLVGDGHARCGLRGRRRGGAALSRRRARGIGRLGSGSVGVPRRARRRSG